MRTIVVSVPGEQQAEVRDDPHHDERREHVERPRPTEDVGEVLDAALVLARALLRLGVQIDDRVDRLVYVIGDAHQDVGCRGVTRRSSRVISGAANRARRGR
jgi:hypothetical protein